MHVFVTVGSTRFDALVQKVLSEPVLDVLRAKGYRTLDVQCGNSDFDASQLSRSADDHWQRAGDLETSVWRFKPTLKEDYERADLIISHAGNVYSPTCIMALARTNHLQPRMRSRLPRLRYDHRRSSARQASDRHPE